MEGMGCGGREGRWVEGRGGDRFLKKGGIEQNKIWYAEK